MKATTVFVMAVRSDPNRYGSALAMLTKSARGRFWLKPSAAARFSGPNNSAFRRPELPAINIRAGQNRFRATARVQRVLAGKNFETCGPTFALHRKALCDRRAFLEHAIEVRIVPACRKIDRVLIERVAIDHSGQRRKRQVGAIGRMSKQQRIALRRFDRPKIVELDDELVLIEEWRAGNLAADRENRSARNMSSR